MSRIGNMTIMLTKDLDGERLRIKSDVDVAKLATVPSDTIVQIIGVCLFGANPIQIDHVIFWWIFWQDTHPFLRVLHLPDPPDTIYHTVMEPE